MRRAAQLLVPAFLIAPLLILASCDDDSGPAEPPAEFGGVYLLRYTLNNDPLEISCSATGTSTILQSGSTFTGTFAQTGECTSPVGSEDFSGEGLITNGSVSGTQVHFEVEECRFDGTVVGTPPNGGSGDVRCTFADDGLTFEMEGNWAVTEGVASVTISPDPVMLPVGESVQLSAALHGPDGGLLADRSVVWESSQPSVVEVDATGLVSAANPGTATVTATSVPIYPLEEPVSAEAGASARIRFVSIEAGVAHTCGLGGGGMAFCWGWNSDGQVGAGSVGGVELEPRLVSGGMTFRSVSPGFLHTCGIVEPEGGYCWGSNMGGALGDGSGQSTPTPVPISGGGGLDEVVAGTYMSCGMVSMGPRYCWGSNDSGQLGIGMVGGPDQPTPVEMTGAGGIVFISLTKSPSGGGTHACGFEINFSSEPNGRCWGQGVLGEIGNGDTQNCGDPELVLGGLQFVAISAGFGHSCGITPEGDAYCWGYQISGALGTGVTEPAVQTTPVPVAGGHKFESISAGDHFTCAVATDGKAWCWGWGGSNQLGNGQAVDRLEPALVAGGLTFESVSSGSGYACGMATDRYAYCWGANGFGQLGTGDQQARATPTRVGLQEW